MKKNTPAAKKPIGRPRINPAEPTRIVCIRLPESIAHAIRGNTAAIRKLITDWVARRKKK